ncbi:MAG: DUF4011 domain-containing protein [Candidatus Melainabacteria bacterium]|nr:DUF4011 domain-containing protein [Candidatus Melainabacteria bacterium]
MTSTSLPVDMESQKANELAELIKARVNNLRPKLLDMSRRNPLISPKLGPRSNSHIQVVDELPEVLFNNLASQNKMRFCALPSLDEDPSDEESVEFQDALSQERATDEEYQRNLESLSQDSDENLEAYRNLERELKDRVRSKRSMPDRQTRNETSLSQHAKNHGISSSYELPKSDETHEDGRHIDKDIQTLLLPDALERKLSKIITTCSSWTQETGIHVLYSAYGFLEWKDLKSGEMIFAPLVLLPVVIEKIRSAKGTQFWVVGQEAEGELNTVLQEKLKQDFGIKMPTLDGANLERFFEEIGNLSPTNVSWKVKRQVVFGVFPSARIAMYHDLDITNHEFQNNSAIASLLAGSGNTGVTLFGDEYNTDDPEIEKKAPLLVMDADSSQFSTLVDVVDGKHLAVEGPPGTGKSQTIVNAIAAALDKKKKVLFVAEKSAALNVVKARLEQVGLGHFVLALQADKSSREKVFESISSRLNMGHVHPTKDLSQKILRFQEARSEIQSYLEVLTTPVGITGLTVYEAMGKAINTSDRLAAVPEQILRANIVDIDRFDQLRIEKGLILASAVTEAWQRTVESQPHWSSATVVDLDKFTAEQICDAATKLAEHLEALKSVAQKACVAGLNETDIHASHMSLLEKLESLAKQAESVDVKAASSLPANRLSEISEFLELCQAHSAHSRAISGRIGVMSDLPSSDIVREAARLAKECSDDLENLSGLLAKRELLCATKAELEGKFFAVRSFVEKHEFAANWPVRVFGNIVSLAGSVNKKVLKLRTELDTDDFDGPQIEMLSKRGLNLLKIREELNSRFYMSRVKLEADELFGHITALKNSSLLSAFDSAFKNAKSAYLSLSRAGKFSKQEAIDGLNDLAEWKQLLEDFSKDRKAQALFGKKFDLEVDFEQFAELGKFVDDVQEAYPDESHNSVREFLFSQSREKLLSCPSHDFGEFAGASYLELVEKLNAIEGLLQPLNALKEHVDKHIKAVPILLSLRVLDLDDIAGSLDALAATAKQCDDNLNIKTHLGEYFRGTSTNYSLLLPAVRFAEVANELEPDVSDIFKLITAKELSSLIDSIRLKHEHQSKLDVSIVQLSRISGITADEIRRLNRGEENPAALFRYAGTDRSGLFAYADLRTALRDLTDAGLGWIAEVLLAEGASLNELNEIVKATIYLSMTKHVYSLHSRILSKYSGRKLDECRAALAQYDREIIRLSRESLKEKLRYSSEAPDGISQGRKSEFTEMALIKNELGKKRGFISVRDLTKRAQTALLELKPCWMMSPLAVAQYLQQGDCPFDLVIIDEASQMPPENALGALVRGKQAMIVGDTNQLPPSNFFSTAFSDDETDEDESVLEESVLELANSAFRPARRLKWHYRSKHSSLINFSNKMVYNSDLVVFPGPSEEKSDLGITLHSVEGLYRTGLNEREADAMIAAIQEFMKNSPDRSLGVVTMNRKQRDLLQERLEHALMQNSNAAAYIDKWKKKNDGLEEFFIKNLENVQGDERDVIFIGTVYGPSEPGGKTANRFGPINGLAGKRRLNVLFSRAKMKIVTFTSMTPTDITAEEERNAGAFMLKKWLEYSASGGFLGGIETGRATDSDFEDYVIQQLKSIGCEAVPQVGAAGYFIDIGVKHPAWPYGYILGVECDGAAYHSSRSARDRDRLRQEVLEGLGWRFHRIWSTDWFNDPKHQADVLRDVVTKRLKELNSAKIESMAVLT